MPLVFFSLFGSILFFNLGDKLIIQFVGCPGRHKRNWRTFRTIPWNFVSVSQRRFLCCSGCSKHERRNKTESKRCQAKVCELGWYFAGQGKIIKLSFLFPSFYLYLVEAPHLPVVFLYSFFELALYGSVRNYPKLWANSDSLFFCFKLVPKQLNGAVFSYHILKFFLFVGS